MQASRTTFYPLAAALARTWSSVVVLFIQLLLQPLLCSCQMLLEQGVGLTWYSNAGWTLELSLAPWLQEVAAASAPATLNSFCGQLSAVRPTMEMEKHKPPRHPKVALLRALWSLLDGSWGVLKGSWTVLPYPKIESASRLQYLR